MRLAVSIEPSEDDAGARGATSQLLPATSQFVTVTAPARLVGRAYLKAELVLEADLLRRRQGESSAAFNAGNILLEDTRLLSIAYLASPAPSARARALSLACVFCRSLLRLLFAAGAGMREEKRDKERGEKR